MAGHEDRMRTSAEIAEHVGTNAVVVRRVLGKLRTAGILTSEKGHAGGWRLARSAAEITLADVYTALDERLVAGDRDAISASECSVETDLHHRLVHVLEEVEQSLIARLGETSILDVHPAHCGFCGS